MNFSSKYDMHQRVVAIMQTAVDRPDRACDACEGTGLVELRGAKFDCPACKGKKELRVTVHGWVIRGEGRVGKISIDHVAPSWDERWGDGEVKAGVEFSFVKYMLDSTGIGSGSVYNEPDLWPSRKEAQAECNRRNGWSSP